MPSHPSHLSPVQPVPPESAVPAADTTADADTATVPLFGPSSSGTSSTLLSTAAAGPSAAPERPERHTVLYDNECPLCTFQMSVLTWLDWFGVLRLLPLSDPSAATMAPHLTRSDLQEAIHCLAHDGRIHRGARCIRFVGLRLPLLVPVALFLWIPGVIQIAEIIYQWISRHRLLLSRLFGCKGACAVLPPRPRPQDNLKS